MPMQEQALTIRGMPYDPDTTPRTPEETEMVRNLLTGMRAFERRGIFIDHEWCRVRRAPRAGAETMTIEVGSRRLPEE